MTLWQGITSATLFAAQARATALAVTDPGRHFGVGLNFTVRNGPGGNSKLESGRPWLECRGANPDASASPPNSHSALPSTSESRDGTACSWPQVAPRDTPFRS